MRVAPDLALESGFMGIEKTMTLFKLSLRKETYKEYVGVQAAEIFCESRRTFYRPLCLPRAPKASSQGFTGSLRPAILTMQLPVNNESDVGGHQGAR